MTPRLPILLLAATMLANCAERGADMSNAAPPAATAAAAAAATSARYAVGQAGVLALLDARAPFPADLFTPLAPEETGRLLRAGGEAIDGADGKLAWHGSVWAFLVDVGGKRVLVDTGGGAAMGGGLATGLAAAGVTPASVDAIVISHMHGDHVGGLLDAAGAPVYPRATLHLHADEAGYWGDATKAGSAPAESRAMFDSARRILAAYGDRVRLFRDATELVPGFSAEPLIGHTPGHTVYRLRSGKAEMAFIGDMIHSLAVQMPRPDVTLKFDNDQARARDARTAFLRANAGRGVLFAGPHFRPGVVTIEPAGAAYRARAVTAR